MIVAVRYAKLNTLTDVNRPKSKYKSYKQINHGQSITTNREYTINREKFLTEYIEN